jgi:hypothetical protein
MEICELGDVSVLTQPDGPFMTADGMFFPSDMPP